MPIGYPSQQGQRQQQGMPVQQPVMSKGPVVITTKDLDYLKDEMSWLLVATKKCAHFANECQDPQVKQLIDRIGKTHQQHYNTLLSHCQNPNVTNVSQTGWL